MLWCPSPGRVAPLLKKNFLGIYYDMELDAQQGLGCVGLQKGWQERGAGWKRDNGMTPMWKMKIESFRLVGDT